MQRVRTSLTLRSVPGALLLLLVLLALYLRLAPVQAAPISLTPAFSLPSGYYDHDIRITLRSPHPEARLFFTLDGSIPAPDTATRYTRPLPLSADTPTVVILRACALFPDGSLGPTVTASYFLALPASLPLLSLVVDPADLWDSQHGIYANPLQHGVDWERPAVVTYIDQDHHLGFEVAAGVRLHGNKSRELDKKGLRLYFRQEYGIGQLDYPLFPDSSVHTFDCLVLHNGGQDWAAYQRDNWTLLRNPLTDRLALELGSYATHNRPALLFINGEPWGIYYIRERLDDHFLENYHHVTQADFLEDAEHPVTDSVLAGDRENWESLIRFLETHTLTDPEAYAYVESQVDLDNLIDYNLLQIYAGNIDWPGRNIQQFRARVQGGRWHWLFWDNDHTFAADPHGHLDSNLVEMVLDEQHHAETDETEGEGSVETEGHDTLLLRKLLENSTFRTRFLTRAADLLNTTLAPDGVIAHIDGLATEVAPDVDYETLRWGSPNDWAANVEELREFARLRPDILRQHLINSLDLRGTTSLTFTAPTSGQGSVALNGTLLPDLPWSGTFFLDLPLTLTAAPTPGYRFIGWSDPDLPATPSLTLTPTTALTFTPLFAPLDPEEPQPGDLTFTGLDHAGQTTWVGLRVQRAGGVDLRGWRFTDNDSKTATDEGSLVFVQDPVLAHVPQGTLLHITLTTDGGCPPDRVALQTRELSLCPGNGLLDAAQDPGFILGSQEAVILLAPGPTAAFEDDQGIAFFSNTDAVTPTSFGVLSDGVR